MTKVNELTSSTKALRCITQREFANLSTYHISHVRFLTRSRKLISFKIGNRVFIDIKEAEFYMLYKSKKSKGATRKQVTVNRNGKLSLTKKVKKSNLSAV